MMITIILGGCQQQPRGNIKMSELTNDKTRIAFTQAELSYLKSFLDAGDRSGFYL